MLRGIERKKAMSPGTIIRKVGRNIRDYGVAVTVQKSLATLVAFVYESTAYRIYRKEIDPSVDTGKQPPHPFKLHVLCTSDGAFISQIEEMEEWLAGKVLEMLNGGSLCVLLLDGDKVAGFNLFSVGEVYMPLVKTKRTFRSHEAWSEQITVHKDYRGMGLATILRLQAFLELGNRGIRKFYGGTLPSNITNRKLSKKVGFREIADIHYRKVLGSTSWCVKRVRDEI